eukprot:Seg3791.4 transcript_id=Seg3791.4/GoldUCD/mRNA.D3Y31 product="hypothetical protein" protein_id=Seg3791.4/GoldUCD/D3Y31
MRDPKEDKVVFNKQVYDQVWSKFGFKCIYFNADSLLNKIAELETLVAEQDPDIIAITETLPKNCEDPVQESELSINGYDIHYNTLKQGSRGVSLYTKKSLNCLEVNKKNGTIL